MKAHSRHLIAVLIFLGFSVQLFSQVWPRHVIDNGSSGADGVRIGDINHDGLPDITTGWEEEGLTRIYVHPGYAQVTAKWPSVNIGHTPSVEDAVFADIDADGSTDVISCTEGQSMKIFVHWGPEEGLMDHSKWQIAPLPASEGITQWMFAVPLDVDGLNGIDIIAGSKGVGGTVGWFQSPDDPRILKDWTWHQLSNATWIMSLIAHDVNGDGHMDIVLSDRKPGTTNGIRWLENPGASIVETQKWNNHFIGARGMEVMFMDVADLDKDGLQDVVICERTEQNIIYFRKLDAGGLRWKPYKIPIPATTGLAKAVKVADVDGDGKPDIVYSSNTMGDDLKAGVYWLSCNDKPTAGGWQWHPISGTEGYKFDRLELLDLDGDGDLDVLTCEENYGPESRGLGVIWYENTLY